MGLDENGRPTKEPNYVGGMTGCSSIREARRKLMGLDAVASDAGSIPVAREYVGVNVAGLVRPGGADA
jgi:hypothetical protein